MEKMIKEIRLQLQMSQEEFAKKLKVSFGTVNRWENGHVLPNRLAQSKLYELCKEKDISVGMDWAMMIAFHRGKMESVKGTSFYENYREKTKQKDLIIGNIANDRMFYVIDNFFLGNITDKALTSSLSALQLGKQYVAVSQKGCGAVEIECEIELSHMERQFLKDEAEQNRVKGISLANEICKNYRREGLFFDEILENIKTGGREWMDYN